MQWLMLLVSTAAISSALPAEGSEGLVKRDVTIATVSPQASLSLISLSIDLADVVR